MIAVEQAITVAGGVFLQNNLFNRDVSVQVSLEARTCPQCNNLCTGLVVLVYSVVTYTQAGGACMQCNNLHTG